MLKKVAINSFIFVVLGCLYATALFETSSANIFSGPHINLIKNKLNSDINLKSRGAQYFPFSSYPMYSEVFDPGNLTFIELRGTKQNGEELYLHGRHYFHPLWRRRAMLEVYLAFLSTGQSSEDFLKIFWKEYHQKRKNQSWGYQGAPGLKSMDLYLVNWKLRDWIEHKRNNPDILTLYDWKNRKSQPEKILKLATVHD